MYTHYFLGCLYYKVGDHHKAINALKECKKSDKDLIDGPATLTKKKSEEVVGSAEKFLNYICENCVESKWWTWWWSSSFSTNIRKFIFLTLSSAFIFLILIYPIIYITRILPKISQTLSDASINETSDLVYLEYTSPGSPLYFATILFLAIIFLSPYITSFTLKHSNFEAEVNCPKGFEFEFSPSLADDLAQLLDDIRV